MKNKLNRLALVLGLATIALVSGTDSVLTAKATPPVCQNCPATTTTTVQVPEPTTVTGSASPVEPVFLHRNNEPTLNVNNSGKVVINNGRVVENNGANLLKVQVWGIIFNVVVQDDRNYQVQSMEPCHQELMPCSSVINPPFVDARVGDIVDISGPINRDSGQIMATHFKNRTNTNRDIEAINERIRDLMRQIEELRARTRLNVIVD